MIAEYTAVRDRLAAEPVLNGKIYDAVRVNAQGQLVREQYLLLFPNVGDADDARFSSGQAPDSDTEYEYRIRAVGVSTDAVLQLLTRVKAQLSGHVLIVAGRTCTAASIEDDGAVDADFSVTPPLLYCDVYVTFRSNRA